VATKDNKEKGRRRKTSNNTNTTQIDKERGEEDERSYKEKILKRSPR